MCLNTTVNELGSGNLPSGHNNITFTLSDGNWTKHIKLPVHPRDKDSVTIHSLALYTAYLDVTNVDIPLQSLAVENGSNYCFIYNISQRKWVAIGDGISYLTANDVCTTVNELGSGNLPSGYNKITFTLSDGNWTEHVKLPVHPQDKDSVSIRSFALYTAHLDTTDVDIPLASLAIEKGSNYCLIYNNTLKKWVISGKKISYLTPNKTGDEIPKNSDHLVFYSLSDGNWVSTIKLPTEAKNGNYVIIRSSAAYSSKVLNTNMLYGSTTTIFKNDEYVFKYLSGFKGWVVESAPLRTLRAECINFQIPHPTSQRTIISFCDGNWIPKIKLPETAGDRDKVSLRSKATYVSIIDSSNVNTPGVMQLHAGDQYDFLYIAENKKWQLMIHPDTLYEAKNIADGKVANLTRPRTIINVSNDNYHQQLELPSHQPVGSRVIVKTCAECNFKVLADEKGYTITNGEIVAFKVGENNEWCRETITIDLLLLYGHTASARLGEGVMRDRLTEAFNMTNEALENSGANFRYRMRALRQIIAKTGWRGLKHPLCDLPKDPVVKGWRDELGANGIYYEGAEKGCGLAYYRPDAAEMVATGSIEGGNTVMRHELGHNMGLQHGGESSSYNQGYRRLRTIMGGNDIPYYSTPHRYTQDYGIPMGIPDKIDAVRAMNEHSATVANYNKDSGFRPRSD